MMIFDTVFIQISKKTQIKATRTGCSLAFVGALLTLIFGGCASVPNVNLDHNTAGSMRRIAVLQVPEPKDIAVINMGGAAMAFGAVGGLVQGLNNVDHSKAFATELKRKNELFGEEMITALEASLKRDGYEVVVERVQKPKPTADGKGDDYTNVTVNADLILSVWFGPVGYMSSPYSTHYEPWVVIKARLLDAKTKKEVYFKTFCVGYKMKVENLVQLPADSRYRYGSYDDLMAHVDDAALGLSCCCTVVARQIGSDLDVD